MSPSIPIRLLATQSDTRLVELASAGHERAFEALVQRYRRPLLGYCRRLLLGEERAEDALQQGFLSAWLALRRGVQVREVKPWLYRIVHNAAVNVLRGTRYDHAQLSESLSGADAPEHDLERRIAVREALAGLAALPEMQRAALLQTAVEGRSHEDVAAALGLSEGALRGLVYRARVSLRSVASAIVPGPLVNWAAGAVAGGDGVGARAVELGVGGGTAGLGGLLLKAGAVAVSTGVLASGLAPRLVSTPAHPRGEGPVLPAGTHPARLVAPGHELGAGSNFLTVGVVRPASPSAVRRGGRDDSRGGGSRREGAHTAPGRRGHAPVAVSVPEAGTLQLDDDGHGSGSPDAHEGHGGSGLFGAGPGSRGSSGGPGVGVDERSGMGGGSQGDGSQGDDGTRGGPGSQGGSGSSGSSGGDGSSGAESPTGLSGASGSGARGGSGGGDPAAESDDRDGSGESGPGASGSGGGGAGGSSTGDASGGGSPGGPGSESAASGSGAERSGH